ncbi:MAG: putative secreted protein [Limisphaerales bacterium]|nr:MAG: putative secreted protein [Limisphaerales bacterium]KAG0510411.1 MAG: putative secreted protein [Limisphaerales bacterium]TXT51598.1 MAG: putative secreted protein [Limisphaerales bacterium]
MKTATLLLVFVSAFAAFSSPAAELEPKLGKQGALLMEEKFDGKELPKNWNRNAGKLTVAEGVLKASEVAADKHAAAFRRPLPIQDAAIGVKFRFEGAKMFHVGFDPAPGELKKQGHLFSLIITPAGLSITEHNDKSDPKSTNKALAKRVATFEKGRWYELLLEVKGDDVLAQIAGMEPLRATSKDFHVKKPGLVFRTGGKDTDEVHLDEVRVWELK